ncbi:nicotinate-nicotinamide nucleotide adenylyltransferase [Methylophaga sp. 42_25_T18]|nr:nicotinate-nicotinamide nucleotide adenylyltransferase [Methylophaga sp. 42_25_T18]OUR87317.1 nicotinate-nicotinamide nucleotide adenylyltransferase [Methylophaga sp. 42_8_T64]
MVAAKVGILGGTFDPIHFGHLRPALDVAEQLTLDHIRLIPSAVPPHRAPPQATAQQRVTMLQLAIKNNDRFVVDDRELHREGPSYTVDTLMSLRQQFPESPLYLLLGTDAFVEIQTWHNWTQLIELSHIVVMQRANETLTMSDELTGWYQQHLAVDADQEQLAGAVWPVDVTQLAISATEIRENMSKGLSVKFLMPDAVINLIEMLGLYSSRS